MLANDIYGVTFESKPALWSGFCYYMPMNHSLRSEAMTQKYRDHLATGVLDKSCPLCDEMAIKTFTYWKIIQNNFPYDLIADIHHMIVPMRHESEQGLSREEWDELYTIKYQDLQEYDLIIEATKRKKSVPAHFHLHLVNLKDKLDRA